MDKLTILDIVNLISGLSSLILALVAIWLALHFYEKSKASEKQTEVNVNEIKTQTSLLVDISARMLDKFTDYSTQPKAADETFLVLAQMLQGKSTGISADYPQDNNAEQINKFAIDAAISAYFYSGLANLAIQDMLPQKAMDIETDSRVPALLNASYEDYIDLDGRLRNMPLESSEIYGVYQIASGWHGGDMVKNMELLYTVPVDEGGVQ